MVAAVVIPFSKTGNSDASLEIEILIHFETWLAGKAFCTCVHIGQGIRVTAALGKKITQN
jgi:hypothetical protein